MPSVILPLRENKILFKMKKKKEYTGELYKKEFHDTDNHNGVITYLEPDILECKSSRP